MNIFSYYPLMHHIVTYLSFLFLSIRLAVKGYFASSFESTHFRVINFCNGRINIQPPSQKTPMTAPKYHYE